MMPQSLKPLITFFCLLLLSLSGCTAPTTAPVLPTPTVASSRTPTTVPTATTTPSPAPSLTASLAPSWTPTNTFEPKSSVCSPLQDITLEEMPQILQTPVLTPRPGQDDGHHGDDFAFWRFGNMVGMDGLPVRSVLEGTVASVTAERNPYGNSIIIETPLDRLPADWVTALALPTPSPAMTPDSRLNNCSMKPAELPGTGPGRSIYLLYGHFKQPSTLKPGDPVTCGEPIGQVGNTGLSGNPHLHLEMRVGPSGARFSSMGYYDPRASQEEFDNYCTWRVSQLFQLLDPMRLLKLK